MAALKADKASRQRLFIHMHTNLLEATMRARLVTRTLVFIGILFAANFVNAQDIKQRFVGKEPCKLDLKGKYGDFSVRLDKTRNTELRSLDMENASLVLIVEYKKGGPACGVIRDAVQIARPTDDKHPEFRCFDAKVPTGVIVGAVIRKYGNVKVVPAVEAWVIDLKEQKFVETHHPVVCSAEGWSGDDDHVVSCHALSMI